MPRPSSLHDVRSRVWPAPSALSPRAAWCLAVCLVFAADGASTLLGLRAGGRELNPLVADLGPLAYLLACAARAAVACALLWVTADATPRIRRATRVACGLLILVKAAAAASNLRGLG